MIYSGATATDDDKPYDRNSQVIYSIVPGNFSVRTYVWSLYIHFLTFTCIKKQCLFLSTMLHSLACFIMGLLNMLQIHGFEYT